ncbi:MAG: type II toxin-antitoxin system RelE/ParE family toxin [Desulfurivibrio sp.]|nr:MAG: type II toxin-antitoxin system RelE/ParE family toxin [Desulfurivibrio sp.]
MIKTFADQETQQLFITGKSKRLPSELIRRAARRLEYYPLCNNLKDLLTPPGNRLHALQGDREGQHSLSINDQWRICFRFIEGDACDVEMTDYHSRIGPWLYQTPQKENYRQHIPAKCSRKISCRILL